MGAERFLRDRKRIKDNMNLENNAAIIRYAIERDLAERQ